MSYETMNADGLRAVITLQEHTLQSARDEIQSLRNECASLRLRNSTLTGAGASVLNAMHRAGGYHVFDPGHQPRVQRAVQALENAVVENINARREMPGLPLADHDELDEAQCGAM